ncbi:hypothetical protein E2C01_013160 [Portunus trituberculatus]|uniref:Uncharacterized protein n=1 Tax=Portunus trituberculatus TaxID=210409 RepID=A0A5B7DGL3_PORTR|nr:hypothetical protein [Portunus trituberculatus]
MVQREALPLSASLHGGPPSPLRHSQRPSMCQPLSNTHPGCPTATPMARVGLDSDVSLPEGERIVSESPACHPSSRATPPPPLHCGTPQPPQVYYFPRDEEPPDQWRREVSVWSVKEVCRLAHPLNRTAT